ncbi:LOW QUALITY PROTEIN: hypothetical protein KUTeg_017339 [Tegillarca granosa]|uniref:Uncharacterized protein n=1 Tax=Tegillarca granosa TaxID=220873 RepID=A0ABQ9EIK6_TEGGR|nr:LOW QUALITY PROTEIN: hypothetical protein KUTeg_017339 [Tegillarca granosa]
MSKSYTDSEMHIKGMELHHNMTQKRREEMLNFRRQAMKLENRQKSKQREQLVAKVQSIVAEVECTLYLVLVHNGTFLIATPTLKSEDNSLFDLEKVKVIVICILVAMSHDCSLSMRNYISVTGCFDKGMERRLARTSSSNKSSPQSNSSSVSTKVSPDNSSKSTTSRSVSSPQQPTDQQKSRVKEKNVSTQPQKTKKLAKSASNSSSSPSSSNMKTESEHTAQVKRHLLLKYQLQGQSLMNLKRSSSLSSLPNLFQVPKPPQVHITKQQQIMSNAHARRANLRSSGQFSFSNPDLRDIGTSDDQSSPSKTDSESSDVRKSHSKSNLHLSSQQSISNPDISNSGISSGSDIFHPKTFSNNFLTVQDSAAGVSDSGLPAERTFQTALSSKRIEQDIDSKGETLESLSDLTSLEDNSLPQDFNGLPLTSERQQKISHVLSKLSRCLNIQDTLSTLNSTNSSQGFASEFNSSVKEKENNQQQLKEPQTKSSVTSIDRRDSGGFVPRENKSSIDQHSTPPSHNSSASERLSVSSSGGGNSRTTSGMSSDSSVTGSQFGSSRRMSPKGSKSAVHFASFVTEINTSASLSVEDKILVRKLDITPTNSPHVSLDASNDAIPDQESKLPSKKQKKFCSKKLE